MDESLGKQVLNITDKVLRVENEEYQKRVIPLLKNLYLSIRKMSESYDEEFSSQKFDQNVATRLSMIKVIQKERGEKLAIELGKGHGKSNFHYADDSGQIP